MTQLEHLQMAAFLDLKAAEDINAGRDLQAWTAISHADICWDAARPPCPPRPVRRRVDPYRCVLANGHSLVVGGGQT